MCLHIYIYMHYFITTHYWTNQKGRITSTRDSNSHTYLSKKSLSTTAQMSSKGFPIPKSELVLKHKDKQI